MRSREYLPELERARAARDKSLQDIKDESMARLTKDLAADKQRNPALNETWEEEDEDVDEDEGITSLTDVSRIADLKVGCTGLRDFGAAEGPWPGEYIDLTRQKGHRDDTNWPRPA
jgi:hypothetical protein